VLFLFNIAMHNACLFECQLVLRNDLQLTRVYDIHALVWLYWHGTSC